MSNAKLRIILEKLKEEKELSPEEIKYIDRECDIVREEILEVIDETVNKYCTANVLGTLVGYNKFESDYDDDYMCASIIEDFLS